VSLLTSTLRFTAFLSAVLLVGTWASVSLATPMPLPDPTDDFDWTGKINANALRFVDTAGNLIPQDGSDDPWIEDGLWATSFDDFGFGIWNKDHKHAFDGLILMISYRGNSGVEFSFDLSGLFGAITLDQDDFKDPSTYSILGPGSSRPGGGLPTLSTTEGIAFVDLGEESALLKSDNVIGGDDTLGLSFTDFSGGESGDFGLLFDVYGYVEGNSPDIVMNTNPNSGDLVTTRNGDGEVPEASTLILFGGGLIGLLRFTKARTSVWRKG
jgi:hypothetical protein